MCVEQLIFKIICLYLLKLCYGLSLILYLQLCEYVRASVCVCVCACVSSSVCFKVAPLRHPARANKTKSPLCLNAQWSRNICDSF